VTEEIDMNTRLICAVALTACLFGNAPVMAADWNAPVANNTPVANNAPAANEMPNLRSTAAPADGKVQTADPQSYVRTAQFNMSQPSGSVQDGLHDDHRWPAMERCINQTTPADFNTCLASAFMQDGTGHSLSLLSRGR
jgi:hypothetical protein